MKQFKFHIPTEIIYGKSRISEISSLIPEGYARIMLVTDKVIAGKTEIISRISGILNNRELAVFDQVEENPSFDTVNSGADFAVDFIAELVIGVGGGSCMDAAKGIAIAAPGSTRIQNLIEDSTLIAEPLPIICIPTTSGTGSEVTPFAVFTDRENNNKVGFSHQDIFPAMAIIDPELTYSMPREVIINTGLDALSHAAEAYFSLESFQMNDLIALECMELVSKNLIMAALKDKESMDQMAYASMLGGIAITHASTILPHIMGYPLTVYHNVPHGRACSILLPSFLKYLNDNSLMSDKLDRFNNIFESFRGFRAFLAGLTVSTKLSSYGVSVEEIPNYVDKTIVKGDVKITPGNITREIISQLYMDSL